MCTVTQHQGGAGAWQALSLEATSQCLPEATDNGCGRKLSSYSILVLHLGYTFKVHKTSGYQRIVAFVFYQARNTFNKATLGHC